MTPPHALIEVSLFNSQSQHYRLTFVFRHLSYVVKVYNVTSLSRPTSIRVQLDCDKTGHVIVPEFRRIGLRLCLQIPLLDLIYKITKEDKQQTKYNCTTYVSVTSASSASPYRKSKSRYPHQRWERCLRFFSYK